MAPPPPAVWLGKRQMLPNPMAEPAAAATIPIFDTNVALFSSILVWIVFYFNLHSKPSLVSFISNPNAVSSLRILSASAQSFRCLAS